MTMKGKSYYLLPLMILLSAMLTLSACSSGTATTPTTSMPASSITITSPTGNVVPQIGNFEITVAVVNFNLVDKIGQTNAAGEGRESLDNL
jgi:ABC-type glycerol-3-phosphate transport system substrate-binding protein